MSKAKRRLAAVLGGLPFIALVYAACIEPRWLEVTEHDVALPVKSALVIAHVSDLHMKSLGMIEQSTLDAIANAKPDVVVITGDLYDKERGRKPASDFVSRIQAPLGVWYAPGNWEHWVRGKAPYLDEKSGARELINAHAQLREDIAIVGYDDAYAGKPNAETDLPDDVAVIALFHSPSFFAKIASRVDLALAGHTHGGQVRLPFAGAVWLPPESGPYVDGWYREGKAQMFVSRGIGTSIAPLRFLCRPELAIIRVTPAK